MTRTLVGLEEASQVVAHQHVVVQLRYGARHHVSLLVYGDAQGVHHFHSLAVSLPRLAEEQFVVASGYVAARYARIDVAVL